MAATVTKSASCAFHILHQVAWNSKVQARLYVTVVQKFVFVSFKLAKRLSELLLLNFKRHLNV